MKIKTFFNTMTSEKSSRKSDMRENFQSILIIRSCVVTKCTCFFGPALYVFYFISIASGLLTKQWKKTVYDIGWCIYLKKVQKVFSL